MHKIPVSVIVLTKNEQVNITECLKSVIDFADEIIVIDDESIDKTLEIAKGFASRTIVKKMDIEGRHRNWAYAQSKNDWVLSLDSDERVTEELKIELCQLFNGTIEFNGYTIPRRNYIGSYWVRHGGWYPSGQIKLFKKDKFKYEEVAVHPRAFLEGECGHLKKDIIHYSYKDFTDFINKLNRQSTWEAQKWNNANRPMALGRFTWRTIDRFVRTFFFKKGYRDGFMGFMVAFFAGLYQLISYAKYWEMKHAEKK